MRFCVYMINALMNQISLKVKKSKPTKHDIFAHGCSVTLSNCVRFGVSSYH